MNFPADLKYTKDHEWIRVDGEVAYIGITDYAQSELGEIVFVDITTEGEVVAKEEVFGTIEAVKTVSDLFMPVSGEVIQANSELDDTGSKYYHGQHFRPARNGKSSQVAGRNGDSFRNARLVCPPYSG